MAEKPIFTTNGIASDVQSRLLKNKVLTLAQYTGKRHTTHLSIV
jgi:hypothetical protein